MVSVCAGQGQRSATAEVFLPTLFCQFDLPGTFQQPLATFRRQPLKTLRAGHV
jgi:hypothetical protein